MNTAPSIEHIIIAGSGPAGLTAALYVARAGYRPLVIDGPKPGGQLMGTSMVENWPGEKQIPGPALIQKLREQALAAGARIVDGTIATLDSAQRPFTITMQNNIAYQCDALIIATGATPRRLGCPGEDMYWGKGVSSCAVCDGPLFAGLPIVIVGGGDSAMENAQFMSQWTNKITIVHTLDKLTASLPMQAKVLNDPHITILYNSTVNRVIGDNYVVTDIAITNTTTKEEQIIPASGMFVSIGLTPNTQFCRNQLACSPSGHIILSDHRQTSIEGIFAAGDVADMRYRQAITSSGSGCMAAMDAEKYLKKIVHTVH